MFTPGSKYFTYSTAASIMRIGSQYTPDHLQGASHSICEDFFSVSSVLSKLFFVHVNSHIPENDCSLAEEKKM